MTTAIAGVQSCGCITYANSEPDRLSKDDQKAIQKVIAGGGQIIRATPDELRANPDFLPVTCPHEPKGWAREPK